MKGIRFVLFLFAASVLISGCSIGSGGAKVARFTGFEADTATASFSYADGWEAVRRFDFTHAQKCGWTKAHLLFAEGLGFVMNGRYDEAVSTEIVDTGVDTGSDLRDYGDTLIRGQTCATNSKQVRSLLIFP